MKNANAMQLPMSPMPVDTEYDWQETNCICPTCGNVRLWQSDWQESTEEENFYAQGKVRECGECGYRFWFD
jgi:hypothetical protein